MLTTCWHAPVSVRTTICMRFHVQVNHFLFVHCECVEVVVCNNLLMKCMRKTPTSQPPFWTREDWKSGDTFPLPDNQFISRD